MRVDICILHIAYSIGVHADRTSFVHSFRIFLMWSGTRVRTKVQYIQWHRMILDRAQQMKIVERRSIDCRDEERM